MGPSLRPDLHASRTVLQRSQRPKPLHDYFALDRSPHPRQQVDVCTTAVVAPITLSTRITTNPHDLLQIASLRAQAYYDGDEGQFVESFVKQFESAEWTSLQKRTAARPRSHPTCYCLAVHALPCNTIVGTADIHPPEVHTGRHPRGVPENDGDGAYLLNLVVDREWRRQGVGREVMTVAVDTAQEQGAKRLYTEVDTDNIGALMLYMGMGFVQLCEVTRSTMGNGEFGRRFILVRSLT